jgi:hypothetical protein
MSNIETYRQQLVSAVEVAKETYANQDLVIEYDNRYLVDMNTQTDPFLCVEVSYVGAAQADLSNKPVHKIAGMLILTAKVREGAGTANAYNLLDHFYEKLQFRVIGDCRMEMANIIRPAKLAGWWGISAIIPFRVNKFST